MAPTGIAGTATAPPPIAGTPVSPITGEILGTPPIGCRVAIPIFGGNEDTEGEADAEAEDCCVMMDATVEGWDMVREETEEGCEIDEETEEGCCHEE